MHLEQIEAKTICGITARTTNALEMDPATAQIPHLWQVFDTNIEVDYRNGNRVYGIYYDYESDASGPFTVLAGTDRHQCASPLTLKEIVIPAGQYLVFHTGGAMPHIVIETWRRIWDYFNKPGCDYLRRYTIDFEQYLGPNEIKICIAVE